MDAFAVLVIDEAQHLAAPLLEEIRALSELEAGRRLLQIVLVGQPELQTRLKQFQMRQIDQRVTMRCELRPLTKEDVAGYVAHRLATVGGTDERIAFASAAIEMIHAASNGVPRLVNINLRPFPVPWLRRSSGAAHAGARGTGASRPGTDATAPGAGSGSHARNGSGLDDRRGAFCQHLERRKGPIVRLQSGGIAGSSRGVTTHD